MNDEIFWSFEFLYFFLSETLKIFINILDVKFNFVYILLRFQILNSNFIILYIKRDFSFSKLKSREHFVFQWTNFEIYLKKKL